MNEKENAVNKQADVTLYVLRCLRNVIDRVTIYGKVEEYGGIYSLYHDALEDAIRCVKMVNGLQDHGGQT